jgi:hypothetical protein
MLLSLHEKANLFKFIKNLFGKEPPATFDVRKLVGTERLVVIVHRKGTGDKAENTYANVGTLLKLPPNTPKLEIVARPKRDDTKPAPVPGSAVTPDNPIEDSEIPF